MDLALLIVEALKFIFPAYCANGTPVLAGGGTKMDFGRNFVDGKRIFGNNKTFRGFFFGWGVGFGWDWLKAWFSALRVSRFCLPCLSLWERFWAI